jgi:dihydrolipoamide dehydrogenase
MDKYDLAIIGAGPGGYVAAIRAAQKGLKVVCIEKEATLGGVCLNIGCIPSKALLHSTEYYHRIVHDGKEHGIEASALTVNLSQMMARKDRVVTSLVSGVQFLFKKYQVTRVQGEGRLVDRTTIQVGSQQIKADTLILATGSEPIPLPFLPFDEKYILSSTGALQLPAIPKKMLMVGAGIIGLELGSVYRRLGTEVEVIELLDRVTPGLDREISKNVLHILKKQGFTFNLSTTVTAGKVEKGRVALTLDKGSAEGDAALIAIGRRPYSKGLGLEEIGVRKDKQGRVVIDQNFCTSIPNIYAIGDLVEGPMLAHKASEEGIAVVDLITGTGGDEVNYLAIPNVMYTWPEVACVGMTEEEAQQAGLELSIGKIPYKAIPRARCSGDEEGIIKILGEKRSGRIIGLHMIGANASEMIHEGAIAIRQKMTLSQLAYTSHAHPTCSEGIKEAAFAALGQALHL